MGEYSIKEIEIIDKLVDAINVEIFVIEENERAKSRLDYYLCSDFEDKQVLTKKKLKKYKKKIDNCNSEIASILIEFAKPIPENMGIDGFRDDISRSFIRNEYQELIEVLAIQEVDLFEDHTLESIIVTYGFNYDLIHDYIESVCDIYFYQLYIKFLELPNDDINVNQIVDSGKKINDISESFTYNENLTNDPLLNPENEYSILKEKFIEEYQSRTAHLKDANDFFIQDVDLEFQNWEEKQQEEINNTFLKIIKELNDNKIFFFGCSFDNYQYNYDWRLKAFLENYNDTLECDFIEDELKFLENILYDIQNSEAAHDGYPQSGYDEFSKAYSFVSITGYKQFFFSHNKKEAFLNSKRYESNHIANLNKNGSVNIPQNDIDNEKPLKFEIKSKLLKKHFKLLDKKEEVAKFRKEFWDIEKKEVFNGACEEDNENDLLKSTIEDYLEEFKDFLNGNGYERLVNALFVYFTNGVFPVLENKINFKRINKKRVGWALKELYKSEKTDNLDIEYFRFAKANINIFANEVLEIKDFNKSNFYKAFTTNPPK